MIDKIRSMMVFSRVAESGSFRRAAERLGLSASVVSHHVAQLEKDLGVQLLYRSTRHMVLTDKGQRFFESCRNMVDAAEIALSALEEGQVSGKLWIVAPAAFSQGPLVVDIAAFCHLYPNIEIKLEFDDTPRNLIQEGIDVALRLGPQESSSLICRTLMSIPPAMFAAPSYLEEHGEICDIDSLRNAHWVSVNGQKEILIRRPDGQEECIQPKMRAYVNSTVALQQLVLHGIGIAQMPMVLASESVAKNQLVQILPDWELPSLTCHALFPARATPNSISRRFVDFIQAQMQQHVGLTPEPKK